MLQAWFKKMKQHLGMDHYLSAQTSAPLFLVMTRVYDTQLYPSTAEHSELDLANVMYMAKHVTCKGHQKDIAKCQEGLLKHYVCTSRAIVATVLCSLFCSLATAVIRPYSASSQKILAPFAPQGWGFTQGFTETAGSKRLRGSS
jgi:hypothetical protein